MSEEENVQDEFTVVSDNAEATMEVMELLADRDDITVKNRKDGDSSPSLQDADRENTEQGSPQVDRELQEKFGDAMLDYFQREESNALKKYSEESSALKKYSEESEDSSSQAPNEVDGDSSSTQALESEQDDHPERGEPLSSPTDEGPPTAAYEWRYADWEAGHTVLRHEEPDRSNFDVELELVDELVRREDHEEAVEEAGRRERQRILDIIDQRIESLESDEECSGEIEWFCCEACYNKGVVCRKCGFSKNWSLGLSKEEVIEKKKTLEEEDHIVREDNSNRIKELEELRGEVENQGETSSE